MTIEITEQKRQNANGVNELEIKIANGDLEALESIQSSYRIRSIEDVLAFAIYILKQANGGPVATNTDGTVRKFMPSDEVREHDELK